jgi:Flp pilus assembly protein TadD
LLDAQLTKGALCEAVGYGADAVGAFEAAARLAPRDAGVRRALAAAYRRAGRAKDALAVAETAAQLDPAAAASCLCLGDALLANEDARAADRRYLQALGIDPRLALAECGRGMAALAHARWHEARAAFARALAIDPSCADARYNQALLDLRFGAYAAGFAGYPAIVDTADQRARYHYYYESVPLWDGTPLGERRLVIAYEQGLGSQIAMARFFGQLRRFGSAIAIETRPSMFSLLRRNFPDLTFVGITHWQPLEVMDVHLPLMQLPAVLHVAHESDFARTAAYLSADPLRVDSLRGRLELEPGVRNVGIVWHGNRESSRDRWRIAPLPAWAPLARVDGVRFHALQLDATSGECSAAPFPLAPAHQFIGDLDDTAALIELMDLVISVDTAVAHLAGALGRPVWMPLSVLGDYRWGIDRSDSPWYGSLRIFRQRERDDWGPVFNEIAAALL